MFQKFEFYHFYGATPFWVVWGRPMIFIVC